MRRAPLILTVAALGSAAVGNAAAPAGAAPTRSTTIAVKTASTQDGTSTRRVRPHPGSRPKNPDQIVENIGIALSTGVGAGRPTFNPFSITKKIDK